VTATLPFDSHRRLAAALVAVALVLAALVTGAATARPAGASTVEDSFTSKLNHERSARGVPRLATRSDLVAVARAQAGRMASRNRLYHNPNLTMDVRNWRWVGENVGYGPSSTSVHRAFMNSAPHKANILDRDYTEIGIGVVVRDGRVWVAEVFRRPARTASRSYTGFAHTLRYGSTGAAVQRVQQRLGLRTTGFYGHATKRAVVRFQHHQGWTGRGKVGPKTWRRLF
jgi:cysteine-rich secretory family protein/putative peptidoglycan binding protein